RASRYSHKADVEGREKPSLPSEPSRAAALRNCATVLTASAYKVCPSIYASRIAAHFCARTAVSFAGLVSPSSDCRLNASISSGSLIILSVNARDSGKISRRTTKALEETSELSLPCDDSLK